MVVDKIQEARQQSLNEVKPEIVKMWENNEKAAIAQEIVNDVTNDLENGDSIDEIAGRFQASAQDYQAPHPFGKLCGVVTIADAGIVQRRFGQSEGHQARRRTDYCG